MVFYLFFCVLSALYCGAYLVYCIGAGQGRAAAGAALLLLVSAAASALVL